MVSRDESDDIVHENSAYFNSISLWVLVQERLPTTFLGTTERDDSNSRSRTKILSQIEEMSVAGTTTGRQVSFRKFSQSDGGLSRLQTRSQSNRLSQHHLFQHALQMPANAQSYATKTEPLNPHPLRRRSPNHIPNPRHNRPLRHTKNSAPPLSIRHQFLARPAQAIRFHATTCTFTSTLPTLRKLNHHKDLLDRTTTQMTLPTWE